LNNNIFYNGRANSTGTGQHFAGYGANPPTGVASAGGNDWSAPGAGGMLLHYFSMDISTLVKWRMITTGLGLGAEWNAISEVPNFVGTSDLHIVTTVPNRLVRGGIAGVMGPNGNPDVDIDGNIRAYVGSIGASEFSGPRNPRLLGSYVIDPVSGTYPSLSKA